MGSERSGPGCGPQPTKTDATRANYARDVASMTRACARDLNTRDPDPRQLAVWFARNRDSWRPATQRKYRAALTCHFETVASPEAMEALGLLRSGPQEEPGHDGVIEIVDDAPLPERTSSLKLKRFPQRDFEAVIGALRKGSARTKTYKLAGVLISWLRVTLLTGMRPNESLTARVVEYPDGLYRRVLVIQNSKATNGRANGSERKLVLDDLPEADFAMVKNHLEGLQRLAAGVGYPKVYNACVQLLNRTVRKLFPRRGRQPTIYSARHQFIANAKAAGFGRKEIAGMVGHGSEDTASKHYAREAAAWGEVKVRPHPDSLAGITRGREWSGGRPRASKGPEAGVTPAG